MSDKFSTSITLTGSADDVIERVTAALAAEGFGVLTRIDIDKTLKKKINVDFRPYVILGACNPTLAHKALTARPDVGLMLPCNVVVEDAGDGKSLVRIIDPGAMMRFGDLADDATLAEIGAEAAERLDRVAKSLA